MTGESLSQPNLIWIHYFYGIDLSSGVQQDLQMAMTTLMPIILAANN
jgi:hypothetical protein